MVSVLGWPDPDTQKSCVSEEKCTKYQPKASYFARFLTRATILRAAKHRKHKKLYKQLSCFSPF